VDLEWVNPSPNRNLVKEPITKIETQQSFFLSIYLLSIKGISIEGSSSRKMKSNPKSYSINEGFELGYQEQ
jgi:hypothetical protein